MVTQQQRNNNNNNNRPPSSTSTSGGTGNNSSSSSSSSNRRRRRRPTPHRPQQQRQNQQQQQRQHNRPYDYSYYQNPCYANSNNNNNEDNSGNHRPSSWGRTGIYGGNDVAPPAGLFSSQAASHSNKTGGHRSAAAAVAAAAVAAAATRATMIRGVGNTTAATATASSIQAQSSSQSTLATTNRNNNNARHAGRPAAATTTTAATTPVIGSVSITAPAPTRAAVAAIPAAAAAAAAQATRVTSSNTAAAVPPKSSTSTSTNKNNHPEILDITSSSDEEEEHGNKTNENKKQNTPPLVMIKSTHASATGRGGRGDHNGTAAAGRGGNGTAAAAAAGRGGNGTAAAAAAARGNANTGRSSGAAGRGGNGAAGRGGDGGGAKNSVNHTNNNINNNRKRSSASISNQSLKKSPPGGSTTTTTIVRTTTFFGPSSKNMSSLEWDNKNNNRQRPVAPATTNNSNKPSSTQQQTFSRPVPATNSSTARAAARPSAAARPTTTAAAVRPTTTAAAARPTTTAAAAAARPLSASSTTVTASARVTAAAAADAVAVPNVAQSAGTVTFVGSKLGTKKRQCPSSSGDQDKIIDLCDTSDIDDVDDDESSTTSAGGQQRRRQQQGRPCRQQLQLQKDKIIYIDSSSDDEEEDDEDEEKEVEELSSRARHNQNHDKDDSSSSTTSSSLPSVQQRRCAARKRANRVDLLPSVARKAAPAAPRGGEMSAAAEVINLYDGTAAEDAICLSSDDDDDADDDEPRKLPAVQNKSSSAFSRALAQEKPPSVAIKKEQAGAAAAGAFSPVLVSAVKQQQASTNNEGGHECSDQDMAMESMSTKQPHQTTAATTTVNSMDYDKATEMEGVVMTPPPTITSSTLTATAINQATTTTAVSSSRDNDSSDDERATREESMQVDIDSSDDELATLMETNRLADTTRRVVLSRRNNNNHHQTANSASCASVPRPIAPTLGAAMAATGSAAMAMTASDDSETVARPPPCATKGQASKKPAPSTEKPKLRSSPRTVCSDVVQQGQPKRPERPCPHIAGLCTGFPEPGRQRFFFPDDSRKDNVEIMEEANYEENETFEEFCDLYDEYAPPPPQPRKKQIEVWDLELRRDELPDVLQEVESMSSPLSYDEFGLPMREFTVVTSDDEFLFQFRIHIEKSKLGDGAGLGAHLTFLGALQLKPGRREKREQILEQVECYFHPTKDILDFTTADGFVAALQLTGENLHENNNRIYRPKKGVSSIARENIRKAMNIKNPIGVLGIFTADDYEKSNADFDQHYSIDLDRYGPFLPSDRKTATHFDLKAFLFSQVPNEYPFGVADLLRGEAQVIDISDEKTGRPHHFAVKNLNMYVNETGHDIKLKQNVFIMTESENKVVKYYFLLPESEMMKKGNSFELYTNYYELYEPQRKKHGYSKQNLYENFVSTRTSDLEDNINWRTLVFDIINTLLEESADDGKTSMPGLYSLLDATEALYWDTFLPIYDAIEKLVSSGNLQSSSLQLSAMRKFQWLRWRLSDALNTFQAMIDADNQRYGKLDPRQGVVLELGKVLDAMKCHPYIYKEALIDERVLHGEKSSIKETFLNEAVEEACYVLENTILKPLDPFMWCKVARLLMEKLSMWVAKIWWPVEDENEEKQDSARTELKKVFLKEAAEAAKAIRDAVQDGKTGDLEFTSGVTVEMIVAKFSYLLRDTTRSSAFYLDNSITPKCYRAMMAEQLAYWDACALIGTPPAPWVAQLERDGRFLMVKSEHGPDSVRQLGSVPRSTKSGENLDLNLTWYLVWQVGYVVDCFADGFLRKSRDELQRAHCSVNELCEQVNIDSCLLDFARDRGIIDSEDAGYEQVCKPATKIEYIEKSRTGKISKRTKNNRKAKAKETAKYRNTKPEPKSDLPVNASRKTKPEPKSDSPVDASHRPKKKEHPTPVKRRALPPCRRIPALKIWEGAPTELMGPGELMQHGWPPGWRKELYRRQSGDTKGDTDRYWFTPNNGKLRSLVEVKRYMAALELYKDEPAAFRARHACRLDN